MNSQAKYRDAEGRVLFVSDGISAGRQYGTFYRKPGGSLKRVVSKFLPMVDSRQEAQANLDLFAARHGMTLITEASTS